MLEIAKKEELQYGEKHNGGNHKMEEIATCCTVYLESISGKIKALQWSLKWFPGVAATFLRDKVQNNVSRIKINFEAKEAGSV